MSRAIPEGYWSHSYGLKYDDPSKDIFHAWVYPRRPFGYPQRPDQRSGVGHGISAIGVDDAMEKAIDDLMSNGSLDSGG